ncbi:MAG: LOG family protein [Candidatus Gracilibacteria bacterium]|jgi:hypothetical protein
MPAKEFHIESELQKHHFRVAIFGSARVKPEDPLYQGVYSLAKEIGAMGADVVTGGGPGFMEAASLGHTAGDVKNRAHSIGINISLPFEQKPNAGLEYVDTHQLFSSRLDEFMLLSHVAIIMPGGVGTCLEFFYAWQLLQVKHICYLPLILVGKEWRKLIEWVIDNPLKDHYLDAHDLHPIVLVDDWHQALRVIEQAKKHFDLGLDPSCHNWQQYGKKMKKLANIIERLEENKAEN